MHTYGTYGAQEQRESDVLYREHTENPTGGIFSTCQIYIGCSRDLKMWMSLSVGGFRSVLGGETHLSGPLPPPLQRAVTFAKSDVIPARAGVKHVFQTSGRMWNSQ